MKKNLIALSFVGLTMTDLTKADEGEKTVEPVLKTSTAYFGVDVFTGDSKIKGKAGSFRASETYDRDGFRLKVGTKRSDGLGFEAFLEFEDYEAFENGIVSFGGHIKKSFGENGSTQPFFRLGMMTGSTELESDAFVQYEEDSLSYVGLFFGLGLERQVSDKLSLHLGADLGRRFWQDIKLTDGFNTVTVEQDDTPVGFYLGMNISI